MSMTYYLDGDYRLHVEPSEGMLAWEDTGGTFDGKCTTYIEGFRVVPEGHAWVRDDGVVFHGFFASAAVDHRTLAAAQEEYEKAQAEAADMQGALEYLFGGEST